MTKDKIINLPDPGNRPMPLTAARNAETTVSLHFRWWRSLTGSRAHLGVRNSNTTICGVRKGDPRPRPANPYEVCRNCVTVMGHLGRASIARHLP